jgi:copper resistance protein B
MRWVILLAAAALAGPAHAQAADPHAGHGAPAVDPHAGHQHEAAPEPASAPPPPPTDHAADRIFPPSAMAAARAQLQREHGAMRWAKVTVETAELRPSTGADGYAWEARASFGSDINRVVLKTEGEGVHGDLYEAEVQALYARAVGPYLNLEAGVRQDLQRRPRRTYAAIGIEGLAPYWFELGAFAFLSDKGEATARVEGSYDLRLTQRLVLEARGEANLAAQDIPELGVGSGVSDLEFGLRLRYAIRPEFAPYVGVVWTRKLGDTADFGREKGDGASQAGVVLGVRAWF